MAAQHRDSEGEENHTGSSCRRPITPLGEQQIRLRPVASHAGGEEVADRVAAAKSDRNDVIEHAPRPVAVRARAAVTRDKPSNFTVADAAASRSTTSRRMVVHAPSGSASGALHARTTMPAVNQLVATGQAFAEHSCWSRREHQNPCAARGSTVGAVDAGTAFSGLAEGATAGAAAGHAARSGSASASTSAGSKRYVPVRVGSFVAGLSRPSRT